VPDGSGLKPVRPAKTPTMKLSPSRLRKPVRFWSGLRTAVRWKTCGHARPSTITEPTSHGLRSTSDDAVINPASAPARIRGTRVSRTAGWSRGLRSAALIGNPRTRERGCVGRMP
jgi:hypothetical protein